MTTLLERCVTVRDGLARANQANQTRQEMAALSKRANEWIDLRKRHHLLLQRQKWLPLPPAVMASLVTTNAVVQPLTQEAATRLAEEGVQSLTKNDLWPRLLSSADCAIKAIEDALRSAWRQHVDAVGEFTAPTALERQILGTPSNKDALEDYKRAFERYRSVAKQSLPSDPNALSDLTEAAVILRKVRERLNFSTPAEVKQFLDAVEWGGGPLQLLSPSVMEWLLKHDDIGRFVVKIRPGR